MLLEINETKRIYGNSARILKKITPRAVVLQIGCDHILLIHITLNSRDKVRKTECKVMISKERIAIPLCKVDWYPIDDSRCVMLNQRQVTTSHNDASQEIAMFGEI